MKNLFLVAALLVSQMNSESAYALSKDQALLLSKSRIEALKQRFSSLAYNCFMYEEDCQIENNQQAATLKWLSSEFTKFPPIVQFDRGSDKFFIDGAVRIAKTGKTWGTPVIFNEDLLTLQTSPGVYQALGFFEIIGVMVHEFGHHHETMLTKAGLPALNHHELDLLASRVITYLKDRTRQLHITSEEAPGLAEEAGVTLYQIEIESYNGTRNIWSQYYVDGIAETKEISPLLYQGIICPVERTNGHITFQGSAEAAAFRQLRAPNFSWTNNELQIKQVVGEASVLCVDKEMGVYQVFDGYKNGRLDLHFSRDNRGYLRIKDSSSFLADRTQIIPQ